MDQNWARKLDVWTQPKMNVVYLYTSHIRALNAQQHIYRKRENVTKMCNLNRARVLTPASVLAWFNQHLGIASTTAGSDRSESREGRKALSSRVAGRRLFSPSQVEWSQNLAAGDLGFGFLWFGGHSIAHAFTSTRQMLLTTTLHNVNYFFIKLTKH